MAAGGASGDKNGREPLRPVLPPIGIPVDFVRKKKVSITTINIARIKRLTHFAMNFVLNLFFTTG